MNKEVFINNRKKLMDSLEDNSLVILFAGNAKQKSADEYYQFTPNRNFYYFSGIDEEVHILVMSKENGVASSKLFLKVIDEEMERWYGKTLRADEAKEISGVDEVAYLDSFENFLNRKFNGSEEINLYLDVQREHYEDLMGIPNDFVRTIKEKYPQVVVKNVFPKIIPLRLVKSKEEIAEMQKAIDITVKG
ncbi:MAG: aminopeptidase P N-terminal domain-containing protein, partial [Clostridiaceae bacterium]|nr:aminopeptidase P N-terminal domain-containing protein [Clostridiaceae bacterium]